MYMPVASGLECPKIAAMASIGTAFLAIVEAALWRNICIPAIRPSLHIPLFLNAPLAIAWQAEWPANGSYGA